MKNKCKQGSPTCTGKADKFEIDPYKDDIQNIQTEKSWWCDACYREAIMDT